VWRREIGSRNSKRAEENGEVRRKFWERGRRRRETDIYYKASLMSIIWLIIIFNSLYVTMIICTGNMHSYRQL
jgi:hypothetical protein